MSRRTRGSEGDKSVSPDAAGGEEAEPDKSDAKLPTMRELQAPIGAPASEGGTWLSSEGKHEDESLREEAADRARRAVEPGRPRE